MIKAIIFDFDGVLTNEFPKHYELSQKQITGLTEEEFKKLFEGNIHTERAKLKDRDTGFDIKFHFNKYKEKQCNISSKIKKELLKLSQKFILGIISSAKEGGTTQALKRSGLEKKFAFVYGYETDPIKVSKFNKVLKEFKLFKEECLFITDTLGDILEAKKVGIESIAVDFGYHERTRLEKGNPLKIVSDFKEILPIIEEINHGQT